VASRIFCSSANRHVLGVVSFLGNAVDEGDTRSSCDSREEIDRYWTALSADPNAEQCGWLKDKYGVSWQISPRIIGEMLSRGTEEQKKRVTQAFLKMKKLDIATVKRAFG